MALGDWLGAISMGLGALGGSIGNAVGSVKVDPNIVTPETTVDAQSVLSNSAGDAVALDATKIANPVSNNTGMSTFGTNSKISNGVFNAGVNGGDITTNGSTGNLNQTQIDATNGKTGTESGYSGLGKGLFSGENIMKAAQLFLSYKKDKSDKKIKKAQINHNIKKDQNARDRTKSVKASMGYGSGLSGSDFKYV